MNAAQRLFDALRLIAHERELADEARNLAGQLLGRLAAGEQITGEPLGRGDDNDRGLDAIYARIDAELGA